MKTPKDKIKEMFPNHRLKDKHDWKIQQFTGEDLFELIHEPDQVKEKGKKWMDRAVEAENQIQSLQTQLEEKEKAIKKIKKELIEYKDYAKIATPLMDKLETENKELNSKLGYAENENEKLKKEVEGWINPARLEEYSRWLEANGYLDSDWWSEPSAIERFLDDSKNT